MQSPPPVAVTAWRRWAALGVLLALVAVLVAFRSRLGADLWPPDSSRVSPNLLAEVLASVVLFILAILLYPPFRRGVHRFMDGHLAPLHARVADLHARHDQHAEHLDRIGRSLADLHEKLDALHEEPRK